MKLFNLDSPLMQALSRMADLLWLNLLTFICCLPIVTVGASFTSLHYMSLKMARNEESYISRGFFRSFKLNFKQATIIWILQAVIFAILGFDFYLMFFSEQETNIVFQVIIYLMAMLVLMASTFVYPVLAKFDNPVTKTIKNAMLISIMQFPKTLLMIVMSIAPIVILLMFPVATPIVLLFGFSVPAYIFAKLYNKFFKKLEDRFLEANGQLVEEQTGEDERIFKDELDPVLANMRDETK